MHNKASSETDLMAQGDAAITAAVEAAVSNAPEHLSLKDFEKVCSLSSDLCHKKQILVC